LFHNSGQEVTDILGLLSGIELLDGLDALLELACKELCWVFGYKLHQVVMVGAAPFSKSKGILAIFLNSFNHFFTVLLHFLYGDHSGIHFNK